MPTPAFLRAACAALTLFTPATAMIVLGGPEAAEETRREGEALAGAVCLLDILYEDAFEVGTGTLIRVDPEARTGLILTTAHGLVRFGTDPATIAISFAANPVLNLDRIYASGFRCHPDYDLRTRSGPDLALVEFPLPAGFKVEPMLLPDPSRFGHYEKLTEFMTAGYGAFTHFPRTRAATESKAAGTEAKDAAPTAKGRTPRVWDDSKETGRVRRFGQVAAAFADAKAARVPRPSFETLNDLAEEADLANARHGGAYHALGTDHPLFTTPGLGREMVPAAGDSGAPLLRFDVQAGRFRVLGMFASSVFVREMEGAKGVKVCGSFMALDRDGLDWIGREAETKMTRLSADTKAKLIIKVAYNDKYQLGHSGPQLAMQTLAEPH